MGIFLKQIACGFSTPSNFWDWACHNEGCCTTKSLTPPARCEQHGYAKAPPAAWAEFVRAAKFKQDGGPSIDNTGTLTPKSDTAFCRNPSQKSLDLLKKNPK